MSFKKHLCWIAGITLFLGSCKKDVIEPASAQQITVPTQNDLNCILFVNDTLGFIAGGDKYFATDLLTTVDGGKTWSLFHTADGDSKAVYGLASNGSYVYGVGYNGKIYLRNDAAPADWVRIQAPDWEWMQSIAFPSPGKGLMVSGEGYRSGRIYRIETVPLNPGISLVDSFEYQLSDIRFADSRTGYICGYGAVLKTTDGGDTWQLQNAKGDFFKSISCINANELWIVGYNGTILHTANGGAHWEKQRNGDNPLLKKYRLRSVAFKDRYTGYAAGDKGLVIKTTDGGEHWSELKHLTDNDFKCIKIHPDGSLWLTGAGGTLFHIRD